MVVEETKFRDANRWKEMEIIRPGRGEERMMHRHQGTVWKRNYSSFSAMFNQRAVAGNIIATEL